LSFGKAGWLFYIRKTREAKPVEEQIPFKAFNAFLKALGVQNC
jgi:hypothetical protein